MRNPVEGPKPGMEETHSPSLVRLFGQLIMLPLTVFVQGMDLFVKTITGMQRAADKGMNVMASEAAPVPQELADQGRLAVNTTNSVTDGAVKDGAETIQKERRTMDKDLRDDMLKLVRYKILFVMREYEHAFPEREDLVSDNMDASALTAWKIAEFIQELGRGETIVPKKWEEKGYPPAKYVRDGKLIGLKEDDKKYLRLYYEVLERYPREKFKYEEQQIRVLEEIRDKLPVAD